MIPWIVAACLVAGWLAGARIGMTWRMNTYICGDSKVHWHNCKNRASHRRVLLHEDRDRNCWDAFIAAMIGLAFPAVIPTWFLMRTTPKFPGEVKRLEVMRETERAALASQMQALRARQLDARDPG